MTDSAKYQYFKVLLEAYERDHPEKNKSTAQTAVGKVWKNMKADFPVADEPEEEVRRQTNKWKTLSFTKKYKITDFWSKALQKKKSKVAKDSFPIISQETTESMAINDKTNPQSSTETSPSTTNTATFTLA